MSSHQTLQLQSLSLSDGVDSLAVTLLLHVAGLTRVHDAHSRRRCGRVQQVSSGFNTYQEISNEVELHYEGSVTHEAEFTDLVQTQTPSYLDPF